MPIQCISSMGGNWATSRTFCKKIVAIKNVLTMKNTYKRAVSIIITVKDEFWSCSLCLYNVLVAWVEIGQLLVLFARK